ncbi:MAG: hypothetical protein QXP55_05445 [Nitrososphaerales archaeon]
MTGKFNEDGKSTGKTEEQIKEAKILASRLQRAINTGRSTQSKMKEVNKFIGHNLITKTASILQIIDNLAKEARSITLKEDFNRIYIKLLGIFNEFKLIECKGYETMVRSGRVDVSRLNNLIDIDTELSNMVILLYEFVEKLSLKKSAKVNERKEILHILDDMIFALRRRNEIIRTMSKIN